MKKFFDWCWVAVAAFVIFYCFSRYTAVPSDLHANRWFLSGLFFIWASGPLLREALK